MFPSFAHMHASSSSSAAASSSVVAAAATATVPHPTSSLFFWLSLLASSLLAFVLNYTIFWNTAVNSALTQTVSGQGKDVAVVLVGYAAFDDASAGGIEIAGVTVGFAGSIAYALAKIAPEKFSVERLEAWMRGKMSDSSGGSSGSSSGSSSSVTAKGSYELLPARSSSPSVTAVTANSNNLPSLSSTPEADDSDAEMGTSRFRMHTAVQDQQQSQPQSQQHVYAYAQPFQQQQQAHANFTCSHLQQQAFTPAHTVASGSMTVASALPQRSPVAAIPHTPAHTQLHAHGPAAFAR